MNYLSKRSFAILVFGFFFIIINDLYAQHVDVKGCYGTTRAHGCEETTFTQTFDKGYIMTTVIVDTWPTPADVWVAKVDSNFVFQWEKIIGGTESDWSAEVVQCTDSNYLVASMSRSNDGDVSGNHGNDDVFLAKLNSSGNIIASKCIGGMAGEYKPRMIATPDGGCLVGVSTGSNDGDVSGNHAGGYDVWIVKLDNALNIQWQRCYGGTGTDGFMNVISNGNGGYIFSANTASSDGDVAYHRGAINTVDIWVVNIDSIGNIIWNTILGGSMNDRVEDVVLLSDNSVLITSYTNSLDFDVIGNHGLTDAWLVKLDTLGGVLWKNCYGGSDNDWGLNIVQTADSGILVVGQSTSIDGQVSGYSTATPVWIFKVDMNGDLIWNGCVSESLYDIIKTYDGKIMGVGGGGSCVAPSDIGLKEITRSNVLTGKIFIDYNLNNVFDSTETPYPNIFITSASNQETVYSYSNALGNYTLFPIAGIYTTRIPNAFAYYSVSPLQQASFFASTGDYDTVNFALAPHPGIHDVSIQLLPVTSLLTGRDARCMIDVRNQGTENSSGMIYIVKPSLLNYVSSSVSPFAINGDSVFWQYSNLTPLDEISIEVTLNVPIPPIVIPGDIVTTLARIIPANTDTTPSDLISILDETIYGSYDPNDKLVLSDDTLRLQQVWDQDFISYMIRFQNTGNSPAVNIEITDSISSLLDINSIQPITSSGEYLFSRPSANTVKWKFENINLPDSSTDESASHGFVYFKIKPKNNLATNDVIYNTANIFFDSNPPVVTNTTEIVVTDVIGVSELNDVDDVSIVPNPTRAIAKVSIGKINDLMTIIVTDIWGRVALSVKQTNVVDMSDLPEGVYVFNIRLANGRIIHKQVVHVK